MVNRPLAALAVAIMLVCAALMQLQEVSVRAFPALAPAGPAQVPPPIEGEPVQVGGCTTAVSHTLSASTIQACETLTVTTRVASACTACPGGIHIVLVRPGAIPGSYNAVGTGAIDEIKRFSDETGTKAAAAIVHYNPYTARVEFPMSDDLDKARAAFATTPISEGIGGWERAATMAVNALRAAAEPGQPRCDFIIFFGYTKEHGGEAWEELRQQLMRAGRTMQRDDATFMAHCLSGGDNCTTMRMLPSSLRYYSEAGDNRKIPAAVKTRIGEYTRLHPEGLRSLGIDQGLPGELAYTLDSAVPPLTALVTGAPTTTLKWRWETPMDEAEVATTYTVAPADLTSTGVFTMAGEVDVDPRSGKPHAVPMPMIPVTVTGPCAPSASPTPTATDTPEATATPVPPTPTATATDPPTATPTAIPQPAYLPLALREVPCTRQQRADVVLVIDASSSMNEPAGDGRSKLEAARAGAAAFVEQLALEEGDQAALVQFNRVADIVTGLTDERSALTAALASIGTASETCLVCGLEAAGVVLGGDARRPDNLAIVILLTDGRSNPRPASEAVAEAERLKAGGAVVFTIGLGAELDEEALIEIASRPAFAFRAADGAALETIYRELAVTLPGSADCYWGRR